MLGVDLIPQRYVIASGIKGYLFRVFPGSPWLPLRHESFYPVSVFRAGTWEKREVPIRAFPSHVEALAILAQVDGETERRIRYINVHSAYEAVVPDRRVELSAVRHALAHPITSLTRPSVRAALEAQFRGYRIDLKLHEHKKVYYRNLGEMLMAVDEALFNAFTSRWGELR